MAVTLNDEEHLLHASQEIEYVNNSPQTLTFLYFHLWPNAYQNRKTAFAKQQLLNQEPEFHFSRKYERGFIDSLDFKVNGQKVKWELDAKHPDIAKLTLNQPLAPGSRITITTPFKVQLPESFSRLGHVDQSYQITQWYPKPAVYDKNGWHPMPYLDQGEFYSEFGTFDVKITLPANYTVGATGVLQTASEVARMDSLAQVTKAISTFPPDDLEFPASARQTKTLHYKQDRIHDFAWFADKRFNVLKGQVTLPASKRTVTTWLLFTNTDAATWVNSLQDINDAVYYYSLWLGDYRYAHATAVDGALSAGAGMEYPMVTVTDPDAIIHEVGHNWFYGILASNEREFPWMDEGINTYYETRIKLRRIPYAGMMSNQVEDPSLRELLGLKEVPAAAVDAEGFLSGSSRGLDQAVSLPSQQFRYINYGFGVYLKTSYLFQYLEKYLGTDRFDRAMQAYYQKWKFRHPYPDDLQRELEASTGEKLDWFFKDLLPSRAIPDAKLVNVTKTIDQITVQVKQTGKLALPVEVAVLDAKGGILSSVWTKPGTFDQTVTLPTHAAADRVVLDPHYYFMEQDRRDNQYRFNATFPKAEPLHLKFLASVNRIDRKQLFWLPSGGFNTVDGLQLGAVFYNSLVTERKVNFLVMPMYGFKSGQVTGLADLYLKFRTEGAVRKIILGAHAQRFADYHTVVPSLTFHNRLNTAATPRQQLSLAWHYVKEKNLYTLHAPRIAYSMEVKNAIAGSRVEVDATQFRQEVETPLLLLSPNGDATWSSSKKTVVGPTRFRLSIDNWHHYRPDKQVRARAFIGFLGTDEQINGPVVLSMAGSPDYLKQTPFLNRADLNTQGPGAIRQTDRQDGGFRNPLSLYSREWLAALNLSVDLPVTPFTAYLDLGRIQELDKTFYGAGLELAILNKAFKLYLPVAGSNFEKSVPQSPKEFAKSIRYSLHVNMLHPFKLIDELQ